MSTVFYGGVMKCSRIRSGDGHTTLWLYQQPLNCMLKKHPKTWQLPALKTKNKKRNI